MPRIRFIHPTDPLKALNASMQWVAKSNADVSQLFRFEQVDDPAAPAPAPAPAPVPAPVPVPQPPATPSSVVAPKTNVITLGPIATTETPGYDSVVVGLMRAVNNTWNAQGLTGKQAVGIQAGSVGVDARFMWSWPADGREVISFPEVAYGRSASFAQVAGSVLPKRVSELKSLVTTAQKVEGTANGLGHVVYDLWTSNNPNALGQVDRTAEIMEAVEPFGGYGIPNFPPAAAAGRTGGNGRNPNGYVGRHTVDGVLLDLYYFPAGSPHTGLKWKFIVLVPVTMHGRGAHRINWLARLQFLVSKGYLNAADYLNTVELGVEPVGNGKATSGDITVRGFQISTS